ncbi:C-glycoside deglycosidase beta subunit domain-containing protein [Bilifractor sp. HCP3S3_D3]|uniref:C-glycoside deglycosidase beta subunit domain-containing protein n=1 Tax=Bilifractor sp. HCP3S3_D3 TaxID=3438907 RepID=UPI003F045A65
MEKQVIQSVGFRNIKDAEGKTTGFQFKVRLPYYRGIFLSQIRPGTLFIDGEKIEKDRITWVINGEEYTNEEMRTNFQVHWSVTKPAVLKVKKEGGLAQGYHDLKYGFCFTSSYMPPIIQSNLDPDQESMVYMPEFGHHVNERHLLIV